MNVDYSPLTPARIPEALTMMCRFYTEEHLDFHEHHARKALLELLERPDHGRHCFIEVDGAAVGYFVLTCCFSLEFWGRYALLDEFYVENGRRGGGIGTKALDQIRHEASLMNVAALRLEVDQGNASLRSFYGRSGFAAHGRDLMTLWLHR